MNQILQLVAIIFMTGSINAQIQIIADGSFEAGPGGAWTEYSLNFGTPICDGGCGNCGGFCGANTGNYYVWFGGANSAEVGQVQQSVIIPVASSALLSMQVHMPISGSGNPQDRLMISIDGTLLKTISALDSALYKNGYTLVDIDVLAFADGNAHTVILEGIQATTTPFSVLVDDVALNVTCPPLEASFAYTASDLLVEFTNLSVGAESYLWDFGNGVTSTAENPVYTYPASGTYAVTLVATDSDCSNTTSTLSYNIQVATGDSSSNVSLESVQKSELLLAFPNPTSDIVTLKNVEPNSTYTLVNVEGKVLSIGQFPSNEGSIDLTNLDEGIYYLRINGSTLKLMKIN